MPERGSGRGRTPQRPGRPPRRPGRPAAAHRGPARSTPRPAAPARPRSPSSSLARIEPLPASARPAPAKPPRPVPPLPAGPLQVPISTIDWLVSKESAPARYLALRDLLARPAKDPDLKRARLALRSDQFVRDALRELRPRLSRDFRPEDLARRYDGGYWRTLFLAELGCDRTMPELAHAADVLFTRFERAFFEIEKGESPALDLSVLSVVLRALCLIGFASDERVVRGAEHVANRRVAEAGDPETRTATLGKDLVLFGSIPEARRSPVLARGIAFLAERAMATVLPKERVRTGGEEERFGFPSGEEADLLEILEGLARCGFARRQELEPALALAAAKADHRARWTLERPLPGVVLIPERAGELSRFVTIRALGVMQHFVGLGIEAAR